MSNLKVSPLDPAALRADPTDPEWRAAGKEWLIRRAHAAELCAHAGAESARDAARDAALAVRLAVEDAILTSPVGASVGASSKALH